MNREIKRDVIILGGGCAGLWLANELAIKGYSCIVVDERQLGGFSSTRNQGWLQSGALYAATGDREDKEVADECKLGYEAITNMARELNCLGEASIRISST